MAFIDGSMDNVVRGNVEGWAYKIDDPDAHQFVRLYLDSKFIAQVRCDIYREHLANAGIGDGSHAFRISIPGIYLDGKVHLVDVRINKQSIPNSPRKFILLEKKDSISPLPESDEFVPHQVSSMEAVKELSSKEDEILNVVSTEFDREFYLQCYTDIAEAGIDPLEHYMHLGWHEGRDPCAEFSTHFYLENSPDIVEAKVNPFWHYIVAGCAEGRPCKAHKVVENKAKDLFAEDFDKEYYLQENPDIVEAGVDPLEHFISNGWKEERNPSAHFDLCFYRQTHGIPDDVNPLFHYIQEGKKAGAQTHPYRKRDGHCVHDDIRHFTTPSELYETHDPDIAAGWRSPKAKAIAFYLPQFHAIPENDEWWGEGFTEWRNIPRGVPRFGGHYQPRIPRDLGFYDLTVTDVIKRQVELARAIGLYGFCFYYYNFNGHRLLEKPMDAFVEDATIDFPFCLMWANENWTRRWDGMEQDVLMRQDYKAEDCDELIDDLAKYLTHPNYITADERPILFLYRADIIPNCKKTIANWRKIFRSRHQIDPIIVMAQCFECYDPNVFGFDGAIEFPPHKIGSNLKDINHQLHIYDPNFTGNVRLYEDIVDTSLRDVNHAFPLIKTAFPSWDNDARKQGAGMCFHGSSPELFQRWMEGLVRYAKTKPFFSESFVFVNAWNEWCEGTYLEPDCHYGYAYSNALARAIHHKVTRISREKVLLVGHDAFAHGAQFLVLHMAITLSRQFGVEVAVILLADGTLLEQYKAVAPTYVLEQCDANLKEILGNLAKQGFHKALVNTTVSGRIIPYLKTQGFSVVSLVHELPRLIKDYHLEPNVQAIADYADTVIFAARQVRDGFLSIAENCNEKKCIIRPQGSYKPWVSDPDKSAEIRKSRDIKPTDKVILNVGYADSRKGFDIFQNVARFLCRQRKDLHFLWLGAATDDIQNWLLSDTDESAPESGHFHMLPFTDDPVPVYEASELFFLSSREDPFPTVVLEAMRAGLPVVGLTRSGGSVDIIAEHGKLANRLDIKGIAEAITSLLDVPEKERKAAAQKRIDTIVNDFRFDDYMFDLLKLFTPELRKVSVVIPSYNYEGFLPARMDSIYSQYYPLNEVLALDDCSTDTSLEVLEHYRVETKRIFEIISNTKNSGSGYRQWDKGTQLVRGEFVWIAEADDIAEPEFLDELMEILVSTNAAFAFCDSSQRDEHDNLLADSYRNYFDTLEQGVFDKSFVMEGEEFVRRFLSVKNIVMNVSGVVWRRSAFLSALEATRAQHETMRVASDWKMYAYAALNCGPVGYVAKSLNMHRRHNESVTHSRKAKRHYKEIIEVQKYIAGKVTLDKALLKQRDTYRNEVQEYLGLKKLPNKEASDPKTRSRSKREKNLISHVSKLLFKPFLSP